MIATLSKFRCNWYDTKTSHDVQKQCILKVDTVDAKEMPMHPLYDYIAWEYTRNISLYKSGLRVFALPYNIILS